jgi:simple sugar transport system permease protein
MNLKKLEGNVTLLIVLVVVFGTMVFLNPKDFLNFTTLQSMSFQLPELGLLSLAMMITMLTGGINLSIITSGNLAGIIAALIIVPFTNDTGNAPAVMIAVSIIACLVVSALIGVLNGVLIAMLKAPPILVTLGTMILLKGISILITKGSAISGLNALKFIGNSTVFWIPFPLLIFAAAVLILSLILNRTPMGYKIYMIGSNELAVKYSGQDVRGTLIKVYMISNLYAGLASLVLISRFNSAKADYSESYLLVTVLASVLGGVSAAGGFGKISGLVISLVILQVISSGLNFMRVSPLFTIAIWGLVIIIVMIIRYFSTERRKE